MEKEILIASEPDSLRRESLRRREAGLSEEEKADRKKERKEVPRDNVLGFQEPPTPGMPLDIDGYIKSKGGKEVRFIMVKSLTPSDCNEKNRLLISTIQIRKNIGFLRPEEVKLLEDGKEIRVDVFSSEQQEKELFLKLEKKTVRRRKGHGSSRFRTERYYMLVGQWEGFAKENGLRPGDRVKLWSYRVEREDSEDLLQLAISKIGEKITEHVVTESESGKDTVIVQKGSVQLIYN